MVCSVRVRAVFIGEQEVGGKVASQAGGRAIRLRRTRGASHQTLLRVPAFTGALLPCGWPTTPPHQPTALLRRYEPPTSIKWPPALLVARHRSSTPIAGRDDRACRGWGLEGACSPDGLEPAAPAAPDSPALGLRAPAHYGVYLLVCARARTGLPSYAVLQLLCDGLPLFLHVHWPSYSCALYTGDANEEQSTDYMRGARQCRSRTRA